jgi:phage terminase large subunit-like protein
MTQLNALSDSAGGKPEAPVMSDFARVAMLARAKWIATARWNQIPPDGDWVNLLLLCGRGFGKTRCASEEAWWYGASNAKTRIAFVARTQADLRKTVFEGDSGIIACCPPELIETYNRTDHELYFKNGSAIFGTSAEKPDSLRGPQFHFALCDELAAWQRADETWSNLMFGLRLGDNPRVIIATTPRPSEIIIELIDDPNTMVVNGTSYDNKANLAPKFFRTIVKKYEGTSKGAQELLGQILSEAEGALWTRETIEKTRSKKVSPDEAAMVFSRVVVAIDPAGKKKASSDETGIIVAGLDWRGHGYVLEDASGRYSPHGWACKAIQLASKWNADRIVAETNQGGDMIAHTIRTCVTPDGLKGVNLPVSEVFASEGKKARAEPVSALFEQGKAHMCGMHEKLERQLCAWVPTSGADSPDRLDAMVWALTLLMIRAEFHCS